MKAKKTKKADVERFRGLFFRIGLVISILSMVFAFKWTTQREVIEFEIPVGIIDVDPIDPPFTINKVKKKPKVAKLKIVETEPVVDPMNKDLFKVDLNLGDSFAMVQIDLPKEVYVEEGPFEFVVIEDKPEFPGGEKAMFKYLRKSIVYPPLEKEMGIQGLVTLYFIINKDGSITNVKIVKGVSPNIDAEAVRVVEAMPNWIPGKQRDKFVAVSIKMPIRFTIVR